MASKLLTRRKALEAAGIAGLTLGLAACTQSTPAPTQNAATAAAPTAEPATPATAAKVTLSLWGWWDIRMKIYENAGLAYTARNPSIEIKVETLPGEEIQQKVYAAVAANTGPNMLKMGEFFFKMREQDMLLPYPEDLFPDSWLREMYPNVPWEHYGRHVIPTGACASILIYNKKMFAEAGLDPENPPATWDDFIDAAIKLTQADENGTINVVGFVPPQQWPGLDWIYQVNGNIVRKEGDKQLATLDSPEATRAFQLLSDLAFVHKVWDPAFPNNIEAVGTGKAAMIQDESWVLGDLSSTYADVYKDLGFAAPPTPTGKAEPYYGHKSMVLDISALKGRPAEYDPTFQFLEYLYKESKDTFWELAELVSLGTERKDLFDDPRITASPALSKVSEVLPKEYDPVQPPEELNPIFLNMVNQLAVEQKPVADCLAYGQAEWQKLLDQGLAKYIR